MTACTIGIFDSGVGGLSVLQAVRTLLPDADIIYVADSAHLPYGDKTASVVRSRASSIVSFLALINVDAIVAACNTATADAIDILRSRCSIPIIGVEPGVKPAALSTQTGVIGILVTTATSESARFANLMDKHRQGARFIVRPCPGLAEKIERGAIHSADLHEMLAVLLAPLIEAGADTIVLGCTHYSLVSPLIETMVGPGVTIIDTATAVARQVVRTLDERRSRKPGKEGTVRYYSSGDPLKFEHALLLLWNRNEKVSALPEQYLVLNSD